MTATAAPDRATSRPSRPEVAGQAPRRSTAAYLLLIGVVGTVAGLIFVRAAPETYDSQIMLQVTQAMAAGRGVRPTHDIFGFNTPYSTYGIGMSLLMLVPYVLAQHLGGDPVAAAVDVNAVVLGATCAVVAASALLLGLSRRGAAVVALGIGAATPLLSYTSTAFSEPGVGLGVALAMFGLIGMTRGRGFGPALIGTGAGLALLMRTDSVVLVVPEVVLAGAWLSHPGRRVREAVAAGVPLAVAVIVLAAYNAVRFGSPLRGGYTNQPFDHPILDGLRGLLISPGRGLLWYSPLAVAAAVALLWSPRRDRVLALVAGGLLVVRLVFYARWWAWNGGWNWGPRFLVPAMPALALGLVVLVRHGGQAWWRRIGLGVLLAGSAAVCVVGATVAYEASPLTQQSLTRFDWSGGHASHSQQTQRAVSAALDDWRRFPVTDEARMLLDGRSLAGRSFNDGDSGALRAGGLALVALMAAGGVAALSTGRRGGASLA